MIDKPRLSLLRIIEMNIGFFGLQFSFGLQQAKGGALRIGENRETAGAGDVLGRAMHIGPERLGFRDQVIAVVNREIDHPEFRHRAVGYWA